MPELKDKRDWTTVFFDLYIAGRTVTWPAGCVCCGYHKSNRHLVRFDKKENQRGAFITASLFYCDRCWRHVELATRPAPTESWRSAGMVFAAAFWLSIVGGIWLATKGQYLLGVIPVLVVSGCWFAASRMAWYKANCAKWERDRQQVVAKRESEVMAALGEACTARGHALHVSFLGGGHAFSFSNPAYGHAWREANRKQGAR
jgi:hypothetical protein